MEITKTNSNGKTTLTLSGRLDTVTAPQLQEALTDVFPAAEAVELDLTELKYVSSAGLRVLLLGEKTAKAENKTMTLTNVSPEVMEVFEITGFSGILSIT